MASSRAVFDDEGNELGTRPLPGRLGAYQAANPAPVTPRIALPFDSPAPAAAPAGAPFAAPAVPAPAFRPRAADRAAAQAEADAAELAADALNAPAPVLPGSPSPVASLPRGLVVVLAVAALVAVLWRR